MAGLRLRMPVANVAAYTVVAAARMPKLGGRLGTE
jgi:hypothetical protein